MARLARGMILVQVDLLVFDRAPQVLGKDIVRHAPFAIHTDAYARLR